MTAPRYGCGEGFYYSCGGGFSHRHLQESTAGRESSRFNKASRLDVAMRQKRGKWEKMKRVWAKEIKRRAQERRPREDSKERGSRAEIVGSGGMAKLGEGSLWVEGWDEESWQEPQGVVDPGRSWRAALWLTDTTDRHHLLLKVIRKWFLWERGMGTGIWGSRVSLGLTL